MVAPARYLFVLTLAACSEGPCPLDDLVDCDGCTVRHAYELSTDHQLLLAGGGGTAAVCGTCGAVWSLDTRRELAKIDLGPRSEILQVSSAPDGTLYVVADQAAVPAGDDDIDPPGPTNRTLIALDPQQHIRWQTPLDPHLEVLAAPSGVFVADGDSGVYTSVSAFDATHALLWTLPLEQGAQLTTDGAGGLWVGRQGFDNQGGAVSAPFQHIGSNGAQVGEIDIDASPASGDNQTWVFFISISAAPDGGVVAAVEVEGSEIAIAETKLSLPTVPSDHHRVIAAFDAAGAVKWAHLADEVGSVAATESGAVTVGSTGGLPGASEGDLLVETWDASGLTSTSRVGGAGVQRPEAPIAVTDDGGAWVTFYNTNGSDSDSTELSFNGDTFDGGHHTYLIEVDL